MSQIRTLDEECGYASFRQEYLAFPPTASLPAPEDLPGVDNATCVGIYYDVFDAVSLTNPCFDIYQVATTCPVLWDVMGCKSWRPPPSPTVLSVTGCVLCRYLYIPFVRARMLIVENIIIAVPGSFEYIPEGAFIYFNRTDVQDAIHAPRIEWAECASIDVFVGGRDKSLPSAATVLPGVIDRTQNVMIGHGAMDMILIANGTLLQLQNMTWGGRQGFRAAPSDPFYVPYHDDVSAATLAGAGVLGTTITERGLTFVGVDLAGHMIPQYAPSAAFRQVEVLLGRVASLSSDEPFTTGGGVGVPQADLAGVEGNFLQEPPW